jgi:hypothetical protein
MKLRKTILAFLVTSLVGSLAGTVLADDIANLPASLCRAQDSGSLTVMTSGEVENQTASLVTALCPVERKSVSGAFMTKLSGTVWALDQSSTADTCCHAVSANPAGGNVVGTSVCTSGSSTSYQGLAVPEITASGSFSNFYIVCTVPAQATGNSGLSTYRAIQK